MKNADRSPRIARKTATLTTAILCILWLCIGGCNTLSIRHDGTESVPGVMIRVPVSQYPEFTDDMNYDDVEFAVRQSLSYLETVSPDTPFTFGDEVYDTRHMTASLTHFLNFIHTRPVKSELHRFIYDNYRVYQSVGNNRSGRVLFTGYYEPVLQGSPEKTDRFRVPVYTRPKDLISIDLSPFSPRFKGERIIGRFSGQTIVPYPDRREINGSGALDGKADILAWLKDPVDLFFLQVQGSGKICLTDGSILNVHYHASNGRPYRSIGRLLIEKQKIPRSGMSMQAIRSYLSQHPDELDEVLNYNPSYVFFKPEPDGPLGCLNVRLTPGRSVALDRRIFPPAALTFIQTRKPVIDGNGEIRNWRKFSRFAMNQDTGGAIRGPGRADLFWGDGPYAEIASGHMQHPGTLFFLVLKPDARTKMVEIRKPGIRATLD
ncbi:MAG: MltA domain-containing protein [Desulfobacterales bacterium]|nr:MltA domain-containing protein [Desulfobacterales bacterium]MDD4393280.1 MltA domain-containing protein [Desulfobacterales bacterium]